MIDQAKKQKLIAHIKARQAANDHEILLAPDLYFDGYDDPDCTICANNRNSVSTAQFAARLRELTQRPDISAAFIRFYDYDDALEFPDSWISSDTVYLITSAELSSVEEWFDDFEASDVWEEPDLSKFPDVNTLPTSSRLVAVWWD